MTSGLVTTVVSVDWPGNLKPDEAAFSLCGCSLTAGGLAAVIGGWVGFGLGCVIMP